MTRSYTAPGAWQDYLIGITAEGSQLRPHLTTLDWRTMETSLAELSKAERAPALEQHIGNELRRLLVAADWSQHERRIRHALDAGQPVDITVVANTAEVYRLPWGLLTFADQGTSVQAHEQVVIGYAWPTNWPADDGLLRLASTRPTRVVFAWSAAGGSVPACRHREELIRAFGPDVVREVDNVSLGRLVETFQGIESDAVVALHILCHGIEHDGGHGLSWHADVGADGTVSAKALRESLAPYASQLTLVTLCACQGARSIATPANRSRGLARQLSSRLSDRTAPVDDSSGFEHAINRHVSE